MSRCWTSVCTTYLTLSVKWGFLLVNMVTVKTEGSFGEWGDAERR